MKTIRIRNVRLFSKEFFYNKNALCIVNNSLLIKLGGFKSWIKISNNEKSIYRIVKGSGNISLNKDTIELDWESVRELDIDDLNQEYFITLSKANFIEKIIANIKHP